MIPIQEIGKRCSGTPENGVGYGQPGDPMFTIQATAQHGVCIPFDTTQITSSGNYAKGAGHNDGKKGSPQNLVPVVSQCISTRNERYDAESQDFVAGKWGVRRLTVREVERLFGFPDDYTLIPYRGKPAKDGPRYRALGNSMAVPLVRWLGRRIELVESLAPCGKLAP